MLYRERKERFNCVDPLIGGAVIAGVTSAATAIANNVAAKKRERRQKKAADEAYAKEVNLANSANQRAVSDAKAAGLNPLENLQPAETPTHSVPDQPTADFNSIASAGDVIGNMMLNNDLQLRQLNTEVASTLSTNYNNDRQYYDGLVKDYDSQLTDLVNNHRTTVITNEEASSEFVDGLQKVTRDVHEDLTQNTYSDETIKHLQTIVKKFDSGEELTKKELDGAIKLIGLKIPTINVGAGISTEDKSKSAVEAVIAVDSDEENGFKNRDVSNSSSLTTHDIDVLEHLVTKNHVETFRASNGYTITENDRASMVRFAKRFTALEKQKNIYSEKALQPFDKYVLENYDDTKKYISRNRQYRR